MVVEKIKLVQGDTKPQLVLTLTDLNGASPIDVSDSGTVVRLKYREVGTTSIKAVLIATKLPGSTEADGTLITGAPYTLPGTGGRVAFDWTSTALESAGEFEAEIEITYSDGGVQTIFDPLTFRVREQF